MTNNRLNDENSGLTLWAARGPSGDLIRGSIGTFRSNAQRWAIRRRNYEVVKLGTLSLDDTRQKVTINTHNGPKVVSLSNEPEGHIEEPIHYKVKVNEPVLDTLKNNRKSTSPKKSVKNVKSKVA